MKGDQETASCSPKNCTKKTSSLNEGLLMVPNKTVCLMKNSLTKHKRAGSTGTTGDESYTTDEEDPDIDEHDISISHRSARNLFDNHDSGSFSSFTDIATITDKVRQLGVMHRNSSDSSVYSEKGSDETDFEANESKSGESSSDQVSWVLTPTEMREEAYLRLQKQLKEANQELELRDQELHRLNRIRNDVEAELEDLTASLFQVSTHLLQNMLFSSV